MAPSLAAVKMHLVAKWGTVSSARAAHTFLDKQEKNVSG